MVIQYFLEDELHPEVHQYNLDTNTNLFSTRLQKATEEKGRKNCPVKQTTGNIVLSFIPVN